MLATKSKEPTKNKSETKAKEKSDHTQQPDVNPVWDNLATSFAPRFRSPAGAPPAIQPKLTISQPNDPYEQEADRVADEVMRMPEPAMLGTSRQLTGAVGEYMLYRRVTPLVQRNALRRRSDRSNPRLPPPLVLNDEADNASNVTITDDEKTEKELGEIAVQVMQRKTLASDQVRCKGTNPSGIIGEPPRDADETSFNDRLVSEQSAGRPMPTELRAFMESCFGMDFSHVRIHTGSDAAKLAAAVQAQAFTIGTNIYFGANYYQPADAAGRRLIAHELVHTLQQSPQRLTAKQMTHGVEPLNTMGISEPFRIQRVKTFVPRVVPSGSLIHSTVLPAFGEANSELFTEVKIPGATRTDVDTNRKGIADFYLALTTVAVAMPEGEPEFLESDSKLRKGKEKWSKQKHEGEGAPLGPKKKGGDACGGTAQICKLGKAAPDKILLGDLKPASTVEVLFGGAQLKNYEEGLAATHNAVNDFIKTPNEGRGDPKGEQWLLETGRIDSLKIPKDFVIGNKKQSLEGLCLFEGKKQGDLIPGLKGRMVVYKPPEDKSGIWVYEWIPTELPAEVMKGKPSKEFSDSLDRIDKLIKQLRPSKKKGMRKPLHAVTRHRTQAIQRKPEAFDHPAWNKEYTTWQAEAEKVVSSDKVREPKVLSALLEVQDRTKQPMGITPKQVQTAKALDRVELWTTWGGVFGRFRKVFGNIYIKVSDLYEKAREKLHNLRERTTAKGDGGGDRLVGKIFKTAFKTAMVFLKLITDSVASHLKSALEKGIDTLIEEFFGDTYIKKLMEAKADLEEKVTAVEKAIQEDIQARVDAITKPYEEKLAFLADIAKWLGDISKIVNTIRWAARVVQCLTPPGIGCLKLLLQEVAERALEMVVETCWFQKYIVGPIFRKFEFFKKLPKDIADFILERVKGWLPLDIDLKEKLFPKEKEVVVSDKLDTKELACDDEHLKREHIEMRKLLDKHGRRKVELLLQLMEKSGVGDKKELSIDLIKQMDAALDSLDAAQLEDALKKFDPSKGTGVGQLDDLANSIKGIKPVVSGGGGRPGKDAEPGKKLKYEVVVTDAAKAKFDGADNGNRDPKSVVSLAGTSKDHAEKSKQAITISLYYDTELISQVTGIPTIVGKPTEETLNGVRYKVVPYILQQGVEFHQKAKVKTTFYYVKGTVLEEHFELDATK